MQMKPAAKRGDNSETKGDNHGAQGLNSPNPVSVAQIILWRGNTID